MQLDNFFDDRLSYIQKREIAEFLDLDPLEIIRKGGELYEEYSDLDVDIIDNSFSCNWMWFYFKRFEN